MAVSHEAMCTSSSYVNIISVVQIQGFRSPSSHVHQHMGGRYTHKFTRTMLVQREFYTGQNNAMMYETEGRVKSPGTAAVKFVVEK